MWEGGIKNQGKSSLWTALYQASFYEKYKYAYLYSQIILRSNVLRHHFYLPTSGNNTGSKWQWSTQQASSMS